MRVTMIGSGYVGLVSGACFADFGHDVTCVDKDSTKINQLNQGIMPIFEPGLDHLVARNVAAGRLRFTVDASRAISNSDAVFIGVGTPARASDGHADLSYVYAAAAEIADLIEDFTVIVTKSTVPVGTGDEIEAISGIGLLFWTSLIAAAGFEKQPRRRASHLVPAEYTYDKLVKNRRAEDQN